ncbi:MAG: hypothetical protein HC853_07825 [Anaerolineae bacterium]|nr:hypothetical protein [Anaerolineae bacterium]
MNTFELSNGAVVLDRANANSLFEALLAKLLNATVHFTNNVNDGHTNQIIALWRWHNAFELIGINSVSYRIPYGSCIEITDKAVQIEMRNSNLKRTFPNPIRWRFALLNDDNTIGIRDGVGPLPSLPPRRIAWPTAEDDVLRVAARLHLEMEVVR